MNATPFLRLESLALEKVFSGNLSLNLTAQVSWEDFPDFAEKFISLIDGKVVEQIRAIDMHLWRVKVGECMLDLVFDDYPLMVTLESADRDGDALLERVHQKLANLSNQNG